jgi:RimJ/RimL family protein N-acetyltransferase
MRCVPLADDLTGPGFSDRLIFEPIVAGHTDALTSALRQPEVWAKVDDGQMPSREAFMDSVQQWAAGPGPDRPEQRWLDLALRMRSTGEVIGRVSATWLDQRVELGYFLTPAAWGQGLASEAVRWLEARCLRCWPVTSFWIVVTPGNTRSIALATRLGYAPLGEAPRPRLLSHDPGDVVLSKDATLNAPRPSSPPRPPRPAGAR